METFKIKSKFWFYAICLLVSLCLIGGVCLVAMAQNYKTLNTMKTASGSTASLVSNGYQSLSNDYDESWTQTLGNSWIQSLGINNPSLTQVAEYNFATKGYNAGRNGSASAPWIIKTAGEFAFLTYIINNTDAYTATEYRIAYQNADNDYELYVVIGADIDFSSHFVTRITPRANAGYIYVDGSREYTYRSYLDILDFSSNDGTTQYTLKNIYHSNADASNPSNYSFGLFNPNYNRNYNNTSINLHDMVFDGLYATNGANRCGLLVGAGNASNVVTLNNIVVSNYKIITASRSALVVNARAGSYTDVVMLRGSITGTEIAASIASDDAGTFIRCISFAEVKATNSVTETYAGGLLGIRSNGGSVEIKDSYFLGSVESYGGYAGGLVGANMNGSTIKIHNSYVDADISSSFIAGGLMGYTKQNSQTLRIFGNYVDGTITLKGNNADAKMGGLFGVAELSNSGSDTVTGTRQFYVANNIIKTQFYTTESVVTGFEYGYTSADYTSYNDIAFGYLFGEFVIKENGSDESHLTVLTQANYYKAQALTFKTVSETLEQNFTNTTFTTTYNSDTAIAPYGVLNCIEISNKNSHPFPASMIDYYMQFFYVTERVENANNYNGTYYHSYDRNVQFTITNATTGEGEFSVATTPTSLNTLLTSENENLAATYLAVPKVFSAYTRDSSPTCTARYFDLTSMDTVGRYELLDKALHLQEGDVTVWAFDDLNKQPYNTHLMQEQQYRIVYFVGGAESWGNAFEPILVKVIEDKFSFTTPEVGSASAGYTFNGWKNMNGDSVIATDGGSATDLPTSTYLGTKVFLLDNTTPTEYNFSIDTSDLGTFAQIEVYDDATTFNNGNGTASTPPAKVAIGSTNVLYTTLIDTGTFVQWEVKIKTGATTSWANLGEGTILPDPVTSKNGSYILLSEVITQEFFETFALPDEGICLRALYAGGTSIRTVNVTAPSAGTGSIATNGEIVYGGGRTYTSGQTFEFTLTPAQYYVLDTITVTLNGVATNSYSTNTANNVTTFTMPASSDSLGITASFKLNEYDIVVQVNDTNGNILDNSSISFESASKVALGAKISDQALGGGITATNVPGYRFVKWVYGRYGNMLCTTPTIPETVLTEAMINTYVVGNEMVLRAIYQTQQSVSVIINPDENNEPQGTASILLNGSYTPIMTGSMYYYDTNTVGIMLQFTPTLGYEPWVNASKVTKNGDTYSYALPTLTDNTILNIEFQKIEYEIVVIAKNVASNLLISDSALITNDRPTGKVVLGENLAINGSVACITANTINGSWRFDSWKYSDNTEIPNTNQAINPGIIVNSDFLNVSGRVYNNNQIILTAYFIQQVTITLNLTDETADAADGYVSVKENDVTISDNITDNDALYFDVNKKIEISTHTGTGYKSVVTPVPTGFISTGNSYITSAVSQDATFNITFTEISYSISLEVRGEDGSLITSVVGLTTAGALTTDLGSNLGTGITAHNIAPYVFSKWQYKLNNDNTLAWDANGALSATSLTTAIITNHIENGSTVLVLQAIFKSQYNVVVNFEGAVNGKVSIGSNSAYANLSANANTATYKAGDDLAITFTPNLGYKVVFNGLHTGFTLEGNVIRIDNLDGAKTLNMCFEEIVYTVTAVALNNNGMSIISDASIFVTASGTSTITGNLPSLIARDKSATAEDNGYRFLGWKTTVNGDIIEGNINEVTLASVVANADSSNNIKVYAVFVKRFYFMLPFSGGNGEYTITDAAGVNTYVSGVRTTEYDENTSLTINLIPDTGYGVSNYTITSPNSVFNKSADGKTITVLSLKDALIISSITYPSIEYTVSVVYKNIITNETIDSVTVTGIPANSTIGTAVASSLAPEYTNLARVFKKFTYADNTNFTTADTLTPAMINSDKVNSGVITIIAWYAPAYKIELTSGDKGYARYDSMTFDENTLAHSGFYIEHNEEIEIDLVVDTFGYKLNNPSIAGDSYLPTTISGAYEAKKLVFTVTGPRTINVTFAPIEYDINFIAVDTNGVVIDSSVDLFPSVANGIVDKTITDIIAINDIVALVDNPLYTFITWQLANDGTPLNSDADTGKLTEGLELINYLETYAIGNTLNLYAKYQKNTLISTEFGASSAITPTGITIANQVINAKEIAQGSTGIAIKYPVQAGYTLGVEANDPECGSFNANTSTFTIYRVGENAISLIATYTAIEYTIITKAINQFNTTLEGLITPDADNTKIVGEALASNVYVTTNNPYYQFVKWTTADGTTLVYDAGTGKLDSTTLVDGYINQANNVKQITLVAHFIEKKAITIQFTKADEGYPNVSWAKINDSTDSLATNTTQYLALNSTATLDFGIDSDDGVGYIATLSSGYDSSYILRGNTLTIPSLTTDSTFTIVLNKIQYTVTFEAVDTNGTPLVGNDIYQFVPTANQSITLGANLDSIATTNAQGYTFNKWLYADQALHATGVDISDNLTATDITAHANNGIIALKAVFQQSFDINITISGESESATNGTVQIGENTTSGSTQHLINANYQAGTANIVISLNPSAGYIATIVGESSYAIINNKITIPSLSSNINLTISFSQIAYTIHKVAIDSTTLESIDANLVDDATYNVNAGNSLPANISASTTTNGYRFVGWKLTNTTAGAYLAEGVENATLAGDVLSNNPVQTTWANAQNDIYLYAFYMPQYKVTINFDSTTNGTVKVNNGAVLTANYEEYFDKNTSSINIIATPSIGYELKYNYAESTTTSSWDKANNTFTFYGLVCDVVLNNVRFEKIVYDVVYSAINQATGVAFSATDIANLITAEGLTTTLGAKLATNLSADTSTTSFSFSYWKLADGTVLTTDGARPGKLADTNTLNSDMITNNVVNGKLTIIAVYSQKYQVNVNFVEMAGVSGYITVQGGSQITADYTTNNYFDHGTGIAIQFVCTTFGYQASLTGYANTDLLNGNLLTIPSLDADRNLTLTFTPIDYTISFRIAEYGTTTIIDNNTLVTTTATIPSVNINDTIPTGIRATTNNPRYEFKGWRWATGTDKALASTTGQSESITYAEVNALTLTSEIIQKRTNGTDIILEAVYQIKYLVNIVYEDNINQGSVKIGDEALNVVSTYLNKGTAGVGIVFSANKGYTVTAVANESSLGNFIPASQSFIISNLTADLTVTATYTPISYSLQFVAKDQKGGALNVESLINNEGNTTVTLAAGTNTLATNLTATSPNGYKFIRWTFGNETTEIESTAGKINSNILLSEDIIDLAVNNRITLIAHYQTQFSVEVLFTQVESAVEGDAKISNNALTIDSQTAFDVNTTTWFDEGDTITIKFIPNGGYKLEFVGTTPSYRDGNIVTVPSISTHQTINVQFVLVPIAVNFKFIDKATLEEYDLNGTALKDALSYEIYNTSGTLTEARTGFLNYTLKLTVSATACANAHYRFEGLSYGINKTPLTNIVEEKYNLEFSSEVYNTQLNNYNLTIYGTFTKLYAIKLIDKSVAGDLGSTVVTQKTGDNPSITPTPIQGTTSYLFDKNDVVTITVAPKAYHTFNGFVGADATEITTANGATTLTFTVRADRDVEYKITKDVIALDISQIGVTKGTFNNAINTCSVGDVITLSFDPEATYEIMNWKINNKLLTEYDNILVSGNSVQITVTDAFLNSLTVGADGKLIIQNQIDTMMSRTLFYGLLGGGIALVLALVLVVILVVRSKNIAAQNRANQQRLQAISAKYDIADIVSKLKGE